METESKVDGSGVLTKKTAKIWKWHLAQPQKYEICVQV